MSSAHEGGGFWFALVRQGDAAGAVSFEHRDGSRDPDEYLDLEHTPAEQVFDWLAAEEQVENAGYEMTSGWQWAGGGTWAAVVQRKVAF